MKKNIFGVSLITVAVLYGLLGVILIGLFALFNLPVLYGVLLAIVIILLQFLLSPFFTDLSMKWFYKAKFTNDIPDYLKSFIEMTCADKNMKYPKIAIINDGAPNAFTYGRTKNDARIVISRGVFDLLEKDEVKSAVAHEIGHACHYDMLLMTMMQLVPFVLYGIARIFLNTGSSSNSKSSSSNSDSGNAGAIIAIIALVLYIITEYIILWFSRAREYYADQFSIQTTKNPNALANALIKIGLGLATAPKDEKGHSVSNNTTLGISDAKSACAMAASSLGFSGEISSEKIKNAMKWDLWNTWAKWYEINSTHPLTSKRILAICDCCPEYNQTPVVDFNEKKPQSYFGYFVKEVFIAMLPWLALIATAVVAIVKFGANAGNVASLTGVCGVISMILFLIKYIIVHPKKFKDKQICDMLGEVKVSGITSVPCKIKGRLIGRGDPGCVFNENFVLQDDTGIVLLNYKQPLKTLNKIFALFRSKHYINKEVEVTGWFRRTPVPYVDMLSFTVDGKVKKLYSYITGYIVRFVFLVAFAVLMFL